ncbi:RNA polymerase sigma factor SigF, partial [Streptomyces sp. NPDC001185]
MTVTETTEARPTALPEIADPSRVAPRDARQLSRLFFDQLGVLEEGTP